MPDKKTGRRRNAATSHRLAQLLEKLRPKLAKEDKELADELGLVIERLSKMPSHVSDAKLIELRASGETYRGIGEIVGLDFTVVYKRLQKPANRPRWLALQEEALAQAGLVHQRNLVDLAETEAAIALGVIAGESPQVSALNNALSRAARGLKVHVDVLAQHQHVHAVVPVTPSAGSGGVGGPTVPMSVQRLTGPTGPASSTMGAVQADVRELYIMVEQMGAGALTTLDQLQDGEATGIVDGEAT